MTVTGCPGSSDKLLSRGLTGYGGGDPKNPGATTRVVGDLATAPGKSGADKKTWTYPLRAGVKWRTGVAITSADIKYAFERWSRTTDPIRRALPDAKGRKPDSGNDYQTLSTPTAVHKQRLGIGNQRWAPDYRSANVYLTLLVDGARYTGTTSSSIFVGLNDPKINALNLGLTGAG